MGNIMTNSLNFPAQFNLSTLNGTNGFTIDSINTFDNTVSTSGAGDINGDSLADIIIGAPALNGAGGHVYVVFGSRSPFPPIVYLANLNGGNGFTINGINAGCGIGYSASGAGEVNGDGLADIIIGASGALSGAGQSYVVFGSRSLFPAQFNLASLNGQNGFALNGINAGDYSGAFVSGAGDVNGDGLADIIISGHGALSGAGQSYVVFGSRGGFPATFNLANLNGANGFVINGINAGSINKVSSAGDVNGDGLADIIICGHGALSGAGQSYVVFGSRGGFPATFNLANLNGANGFTINGIRVNAFDCYSGSANSIGDVNGDGAGDIIINALYAGGFSSLIWKSYVVFGRNSLTPSPGASASATAQPTSSSSPSPSMPPKIVVDLNQTNEVYTTSYSNYKFIISANNVTINSSGAYNLYKPMPNMGYLLTILNFDKSTDKIDLTDFSSVNFNNLVITAGSAIINLPGGQETIIKNLMPSDLQANNFNFASDTGGSTTSGMSGGAIAGTVLGTLIGVGLIGFAAWWISKIHAATPTSPTHAVHINPIVKIAAAATTVEMATKNPVAWSYKTADSEDDSYLSDGTLIDEIDSTTVYDTVA